MTDGKRQYGADSDHRYWAYIKNGYLICSFGTQKGGWKILGTYKGYYSDTGLDLEQKEFHEKEHEKFQARVKEEQERRIIEGTKKQTSIWEGLPGEPKCEEHSAYLQKKGVKAYGIKYGYATFRFLNPDGTERTEEKCPSIVIPIRNSENKIQGLQYIRKDSEKRIYGSQSGGFFLIGNPSDSKVIALCEGYSTGATDYEALQDKGATVAVCFNCNNLRPAGEALAELYPDHKFLILGDDDEKPDGSNAGREAAKETATVLECGWVIPVFSEKTLAAHVEAVEKAMKEGKSPPKRPSDFNDLATLESMEEVKKQLERALAQPNQQKKLAKDQKSQKSESAGSTAESEVVWEFNRKFAILELPFGVMEIQDGTFSVQKRKDFIDRFENQRIQDGKRKIAKSDIWLKSPDRRTYYKVEFAPNKSPSEYEDEKGRRIYNIWKGFSIKGAPGNCSLIKQHMLEVICGGSREKYSLLWNLMSYWVQHPEEKTFTPVLRGTHGAGKGRFTDVLAKIFGSAFYETSSPDHAFGKFNPIISDKVVVHLDDALFGGDKVYMGRMKTEITSTRSTIERKGKDAIETYNPRKYIISSNESKTIPIEATERRYFFLDVSDHKCGDTQYFEQLTKEIDNGGAEAIFHEWMQTDLTNFSAKIIPRHLMGGVDNRISSADSFMKFMYEVLSQGTFRLSLTPHQDTAYGDTIRVDIVKDEYAAFCKRTNERYPIDEREIGKKLSKILNFKKTRPRSDTGGRTYAYECPKIEEARAAFAKHFQSTADEVFDL